MVESVVLKVVFMVMVNLVWGIFGVPNKWYIKGSGVRMGEGCSEIRGFDSQSFSYCTGDSASAV